jgi:ABC-type dipeptide/oligopeptide/nickel transport system ATPase component
MDFNLLFTDKDCPHCRRLVDFIGKRDAKPIKDTIKLVTSDSKYQHVRDQYDIKLFPTLVLTDGSKRIGEQAFVWFREQLDARRIKDPDRIMSKYPTNYHAGNRKFVVVLILLALLIHYQKPCQ